MALVLLFCYFFRSDCGFYIQNEELFLIIYLLSSKCPVVSHKITMKLAVPDPKGSWDPSWASKGLISIANYNALMRAYFLLKIYHTLTIYIFYEVIK